MENIAIGGPSTPIMDFKDQQNLEDNIRGLSQYVTSLECVSPTMNKVVFAELLGMAFYYIDKARENLVDIGSKIHADPSFQITEKPDFPANL